MQKKTEDDDRTRQAIKSTEVVLKRSKELHQKMIDFIKIIEQELRRPKPEG